MAFHELNNSSASDTGLDDPPGAILCFSVSLPIGLILMFTSSLTIIVDTRTERLREKPSTKLVNSLALSDGLAGLAIATMSVLTLSKVSWMQQPLIKKLTRLFPRCLHIVSALSICCLTLDRYLAICWPLHYSSWVTDSRCRLLTGLCWLLPLLLLEPFYNNPKIYGINYVLLFILASISVLVFYVLISLEFRKESKGHIPTNTREMEADKRRIESRTSRDVAVVLLVNIALSVPDAVVRVLLLARGTENQWEDYIWVTVLIILSQLLFLPLYAWKNADFRRALCAFCTSSLVRGQSGGRRGLAGSWSLRNDDSQQQQQPSQATVYRQISNQSKKSTIYMSELLTSRQGDSHKNIT